MNVQQILEVAKEAALKAGELIINSRGVHTLNFKGVRDLVTDIDLASEKCIIEIIKKHFPTHSLLTEEANNKFDDNILNSENLWIIDPLDGTMNFAHNHRHSGVSIAFASRGKVLAAVVFSPFHNELFSATKNNGAFCNDKKIHVREVTDLTHALVATGFPTDRANAKLLAKRVEVVISNCRDLRRIGAASLDLCWVACGRLDAYYETVKPWDYAAGGLILREAGGKTGRLCDLSFKHEDLIGEELFVSTPKIFDPLRKLLKCA